METANARIPYFSTLVQTDLEGPAKYGLGGVGGPANPSPQPFVRGEKQWMDNAANINVWGDTQMTAANTRIPYASTLVMTGDDEEEKKPDALEKVLIPTEVPRNFEFMQ